MNKLALLLTTLVAAGCVTYKMTDYPSRDSIEWSDTQKIEELCLNYQSFKQTFEETIDQLGSGSVSLNVACGRIHDAASRFYPGFIDSIAYAEPGDSTRERIAHNLVGHVRSEADRKEHLQPRLPFLEMELQEFKSNLQTQPAW